MQSAIVARAEVSGEIPRGEPTLSLLSDLFAAFYLSIGEAKPSFSILIRLSFCRSEKLKLFRLFEEFRSDADKAIRIFILARELWNWVLHSNEIASDDYDFYRGDASETEKLYNYKVYLCQFIGN